MLRLALALCAAEIALAALPTIVQAQPATIKPPILRPKLAVLPPVEYDKPYQGELTMLRVKDQDAVRKYCPSVPFAGAALACAYPGGEECLVVMVSDRIIELAGWTTDIVRRHEIGHCNGWPKDHRGARQP